jgi:hypothetical protein
MKGINNPIGMKSLYPNQNPFIMNPYRFAAAGGGAVGGWKELGRTTLGSDGDSIDVGTITGKRYLMFLSYMSDDNGSLLPSLRFNNDSTGNYSHRSSSNGTTDWTAVSQDKLRYGAGTSSTQQFNVATLANKSDKEKLMYRHMAYTQTGTLYREETAGKWVNTSAQITDVEVVNTNAGSFDSGNEVVVLGWDPADTHTDNFWEELVDTSWSSGSSVETSAFATKKYLWYQGWFKTGGSMSGSYSALQVGSGGTISTSGYTERYSINGATDGTEINKSNYYGLVGQGNDGSGNELTYINGFILNNSANEKLIISNAVGFDATTGSGTGSEPRRTKGVGKWVTTGSQINKMKILSAAGSGAWVGGQLKVWGSD